MAGLIEEISKVIDFDLLRKIVIAPLQDLSSVLGDLATPLDGIMKTIDNAAQVFQFGKYKPYIETDVR